MFGQKNIIVIWVRNNQLEMLGGKITEPQRLVIPEEVVSHLEVIDRDALYTMIKDWTGQHPAAGQEIVWVFGPEVYFERVMAEGEKEQWESVAINFLELLPFEEVESRVYGTVSERRIVAVSKDYYHALQRGFALQGYLTLLEVPAFVLGKLGQAGGVSRELVKYVSSHLDQLSKKRLVDESQVKRYIPTVAKTIAKSQLPLLLGVFGVLLVILLVVMLTTQR